LINAFSDYLDSKGIDFDVVFKRNEVGIGSIEAVRASKAYKNAQIRQARVERY